MLINVPAKPIESHKFLAAEAGSQLVSKVKFPNF